MHISSSADTTSMVLVSSRLCVCFLKASCSFSGITLHACKSLSYLATHFSPRGFHHHCSETMVSSCHMECLLGGGPNIETLSSCLPLGHRDISLCSQSFRCNAHFRLGKNFLGEHSFYWSKTLSPLLEKYSLYLKI